MWKLQRNHAFISHSEAVFAGAGEKTMSMRVGCPGRVAARFTIVLSGRSTLDLTFTMKIILEKTWEWGLQKLQKKKHLTECKEVTYGVYWQMIDTRYHQS